MGRSREGRSGRWGLRYTCMTTKLENTRASAYPLSRDSYHPTPQNRRPFNNYVGNTHSLAHQCLTHQCLPHASMPPSRTNASLTHQCLPHAPMPPSLTHTSQKQINPTTTMHRELSPKGLPPVCKSGEAPPCSAGLEDDDLLLDNQIPQPCITMYVSTGLLLSIFLSQLSFSRSTV